MNNTIRKIYLYLIAFVGIVIFVIGSISLIDLGLKTYLFKEADVDYYARPMKIDGEPEFDEEEYNKQMEQNRTSQKQRQASNAIAMIIVGYPLYRYHWQTLQKEK